MKKIIIVLIITALYFLSCTGTQVKPEFSATEKNTINQSFEYIKAADMQAPETLSAQITITGSLNNKKYSAVGSLMFNRKSDIMNIILYDFIFKSPMSTFIKNKDNVSIYSPVDNQLILTTVKSIKTKMLFDIHLNSEHLVALIQGLIPLIDNYFVKQIYSEEKTNRLYLIIENTKTYETISIQKNKPDRLMFMDKKNKKKIEVYLNKKTYIPDTRYYKQLHIKSEADMTDLEISFTRVTVNKPVKIKTEDDISIPKGTKILRFR